MQTEMISLMQQLVTAVQSIALSVDVMSMDLRALNKNVAQLVKKEHSKVMSPLTLAPECSYSQDDEASPRVTPAPASEAMSGMEGPSSYQSPDFQGDDTEPRERSPKIRDSLREDIKNAMGRSGRLDVGWQDCSESVNNREVGESSGWTQAQGQTTQTTDGRRREATGGSQGGEQRSGTEPGERMPAAMPTTGRGGRTAARVGSGGKEGRTFTCDWCGKEFSENYRLKRHFRVHTGERPFPCFQCGKAFRSKENLIVHSRVHSEERPYPCELCGKAFKHKENLIVHSRVHSGERPFPCELCGKAFRHKENLIVHSRVHSGEKPFRCEICGKMFAQNGQLTVHRRVHTGERPYRCEVCGKAFTDSGKLKRHKQIHLGARGGQEMGM